MPCHITAAQLSVRFEPFSLKVCHKATGEVYLEGRLERGIVPKESLWMLDTGTGEDGCLLLLHKMNIELLQKWDAASLCLQQLSTDAWGPFFALGSEPQHVYSTVTRH